MNDTLEIQALADGELDGEAKAAAAEAILQDTAARAEYETIVALKQTVKRACPPVDALEAWKVVRQRLDAIDKSKKAEVFIGRNAWALCSLFIVMIVGAAMFNRMTGKTRLYTGDVARVMSSMIPLPTSTPSDVVRVAENELGAAPFRLPPADLHPVGAARGLFEGRKALIVQLSDAGGTSRLLVVENVHEVEGLKCDGKQVYSVGQLNGVNAVSWQCSGYICLLVGNRPMGDLLSIASTLRVTP